MRKKYIFVKKQRILMNFHIFSAYNSEISSEFQNFFWNCPNTLNELGKKFGIVQILRMTSKFFSELSELTSETNSEFRFKVGNLLPPLFGKYCQIRKLFQASSEKSITYMYVGPYGKFTCKSSPQKPMGQLQPNFGGMVLGWPPSKVCVRWSRLPTKMAAKLKIEKRGDEIKKKFSSETTEPISTKLCWNDPWVVPFQIYSSAPSCIQDGHHY